MNEIASRSQLRMSFLRWGLFCVSLFLLLGIGSGILSNSGYENRWFVALTKPSLMPPGWAFGAAWTILYILLGLALAVVINARGAPGRGFAIALFLIQMLLNFLWSPLFFAAHEVSLALYLIVAILLLSTLSAALFVRLRPIAAALMIPYLLWLCFATYLNFAIDRMNPDAETLVAPAISTQI